MRILFVTGALVAGVVGLQAQAFAQSAPTYRYCLQEFGGFRGGTGTTLCRYNTLAQCWASKTSPGDLCYLNPAYLQKKK
jgi:hypothetical protein